jgi:hypothetical protein
MSNSCQWCNDEIKIQVMRGTGACCGDHQELIAIRAAVAALPKKRSPGPTTVEEIKKIHARGKV